MGEDKIKTQIDDLINILKESGDKPLTLKQLSSACKMPEKEVLKWVHILENQGSVEIQNRISGILIRWIQPSPQLHSAAAKQLRATETDIEVAFEIEQKARKIKTTHETASTETAEAEASKQTQVQLLSELEQTKADVEDMQVQLEKVEQMLAYLKKQKEQISAPKTEVAVQPEEKPASLQAEQNLPESTQYEANAEQQKEKQSTLVQQETSFVEAKRDEIASRVISIKPIFKSKKKEKIQKPKPIRVTNVSIQFSERLARQVQKIVKQTQQIERLRQEKERLLIEYYLPLQKKFESELETITDRVLKVEKNILGMQQKAADLPNQISAVEKLQFASIKAHAQAKKTYDEAVAQMEEATRVLSEERERMMDLVEQSRQEIATHRAKAMELEKTLENISMMEQEAANKVIEARAALAEQAERLAAAERYSQELSALKAEIENSVDSMKREMASTKAVLTTLEKQIGQIKQVELYIESLRKDYDQKMDEIAAYIKQGNQDFETLREAVEANFVRRYLRELRQLTESYSFEFEQAKKLEHDIDKQIAEEKKKLEELINEGRKIAHLYELQSKEVRESKEFEEHGKRLAEVENLVQKRSELESIIAQLVGKKMYVQGVASQPISVSVKKAKATTRLTKKKVAKKAKKHKK
ncbi:MAG: hypothetical protein QXT25_04485 [Candidatus Anstonellaceae archaeon]